MRDNLEELEKIFERFQTSDILDTEKNKMQGMFIRFSGTTNREEDFQILEQLERLIYVSEKEGFKHGFKAAYRLKLGKRAGSSGEVIDIDRYIKNE